MSKKFLFICFMLGMFMFVPAGVFAAGDDDSPTTEVAGDVNGDGVLNVTDVMVLANYISNPSAQTLDKAVADINGDGNVDTSDIDTLINKVLGIVTKYYWYVGQTDPSTMSEISPIVTDNSSSGWREIGTTVPTYTMSSPLWNGAVNEIVFDDYNDVTAYIALPNDTIKVRDGLGNDVTSQMTKIGTKSINGVTYTIYKNSSNVMPYSLNLFVY